MVNAEAVIYPRHFRESLSTARAGDRQAQRRPVTDNLYGDGLTGIRRQRVLFLIGAAGHPVRVGDNR